MWTNKRIAAVGTGTTLGAIAIVAIMVLPIFSALVNAEDIILDVNQELPYQRTFGLGRVVNLKLTNVTEEMILSATFESDQIPTLSYFGNYGPIDDHLTIFVISKNANAIISFTSVPGMELTIKRLDTNIDKRGVIIENEFGTITSLNTLPVEGSDNCTIRGITYPDLYRDFGATISIPNQAIEHSLVIESSSNLSYFTITDNEISRYEMVETTDFPVIIPVNTSTLKLRSQFISDFSVYIRPRPLSVADEEVKIIAIAGYNKTALVNETITFDGSASMAWGNMEDISLDFYWNFGDGLTSYGILAEHAFANDGVYNVTLDVIDQSGAYARDIITINVANSQPQVNAGNDIIVNEDDKIAFNGSAWDSPSDLLGLTYEWKFGDGTRDVAKEVLHSYNRSGTYRASFSATDDNGLVGRCYRTVCVENVPPTARIIDVITEPGSGLVYFKAEGIDTPSDNDSLQYYWGFGDGIAGYGKETSHGFSSSGYYNVTLTVVDDDGANAEDTIQIYSPGHPPIAVINVYQDVDFSLRMAGRKWNKISLFALEDFRFKGNTSIVRVPGSPDEQSMDFSCRLDPRRQDRIGLSYTGDIGANPIWVNMSLDNQVTHTFFINFNISRNGEIQDIYLDINNILSLGTMTFDASASYDPDGQPLTYYWDIGDSTISDSAIFTHTYQSDADYDVRLIVTSPDGQTCTSTSVLSIISDVPTACAGSDKLAFLSSHGNSGGKAKFAAGLSFDLDSPTMNYSWNFGDGCTSTDETYNYKYSDSGVYSSILSVTDPEGHEDTDEITVVVSEEDAPVAIAGNDLFGKVGEPICFDGTASYAQKDSITNYTWNFGDMETANGSVVSHTFKDEGMYRATLEIRDSIGKLGMDFVRVWIYTEKPVANAGSDRFVYEDEVISFNVGYSNPTSTYTWNFGDGWITYGPSVEHAYTQSGTYTVTVTVETMYGETAIDTAVITVCNVIPQATIDTNIFKVVEDELIAFNGACEDSVSDMPLINYTWNFGDGTFGYGIHPTHTYPTSGIKMVSLTVKDDDGATDTTTASVDVENVKPIAYAGSDMIMYKNTADFDGIGLDTFSDQFNLIYNWDFGDGYYSTNQSVTHIFGDTGIYMVSLTVMDDNFDYMVDTIEVNITDFDSDYLLDAWEIENNLNHKDGIDNNGRYGNPDNDGLTSEQEYWLGTEPKNWDTDGDNIPDGPEPMQYFTDPLEVDTDGDGLWDGFEDLNDNGIIDNNEIGEIFGTFNYDYISLNVSFFDSGSKAVINTGSYPTSHYEIMVSGDATVNITNIAKLNESLIISLVSGEEKITIGNTMEYDASNLTDNMTKLNITIKFEMYIIDVADKLEILANPLVFEEITPFRINLDNVIVRKLGTNPLKADTDNDGLNDNFEYINGLSPCKKDADNDNFWDAAEISYWQSAWDISLEEAANRSRVDDFDDDQLSDGYEVMFNLDPTNKDPDEDGLKDFDELFQYVPMKTVELNKDIFADGQMVTQNFDIVSNDSYMLKFVCENVINRTFDLESHSMNDTEFLEYSNDEFMSQVSTITIDGQYIPISTGSALLHAEQYGEYINFTERRYYVVYDQLEAGTYTLTYSLDISAVNATANVNTHFTEFILNRQGLHPFLTDYDRDNLDDGDEIKMGSNPYGFDTDGDGLWDGYNPLTNEGEAYNSTSPVEVDTDGDGLWDGHDMGINRGEWELGTDPTKWDTDYDELSDFEEINVEYQDYDSPIGPYSNPLDPDTDKDFYLDGWEAKHYIQGNRFSPVQSDIYLDYDGDGLLNGQEYSLGTDPELKDTDSDGLWDSTEIVEVVFRTNVSKGAKTIAYYGQGEYEWIYYNGTEYGITSDNRTGRNITQDSLIFVLEEGSKVYLNDNEDEIYVCTWNSTDDNIINGTHYVFNLNNARGDAFDGFVNGIDNPAIGYKDMELYYGTDPLDNDTDGDKVTDGDELPEWDANSDADDLINALDEDSDNDGLKDGEEIDWNIDSDGDDLSNMVDMDADNDGVPDGSEILWYHDWDNDGLPNMLDVDSDNDTIWDGFQDINDNKIYDMELEQGEDINCNGRVNVNETNPIDADTDSDGVVDPDEQSFSWWLDSDNDTMVNVVDSDSDNDGVVDGNEVEIVFRTNAQGETFDNTTWVAVALDSNAWNPDATPETVNRSLTGFWYTPEGSVAGDLLGLTRGGKQIRYDRTTETLWIDNNNFKTNDSAEIVLSNKPALSFAKKMQEIVCFVNSDANQTDGANIIDGDSDNDGIRDGLEDVNNNGLKDEDETHPYYVDTDRDGIGDGLEDRNVNGLFEDGETNPLKVDTDGDRLWDGVNATGEGEDKNCDGDVDIAETDPRNQDSDGDGIVDSVEWNGDDTLDVANGETNPRDVDTDEDGLWDGESIGIYLGETTLGTSSTNPDSDGDGVNDGTELGLTNADIVDILINSIFTYIVYQTSDDFVSDRDPQTITNPLNVDSDNDGLWDGKNNTGIGEDLNGDGSSLNQNETDAAKPDTDGDGLWDGYNRTISDIIYIGELAIFTNPLDVDSDDDGLIDGYNTTLNGITYIGEYEWLNPLTWDYDRDYISDGAEIGRYYDPANPTLDNIQMDWEIIGIKGTDINIFISDADPSTFTDPKNNDTDDDGILDGIEDNLMNVTLIGNYSGVIYLLLLETDPLRKDSDLDGILDGVEDYNHNGIWEPGLNETCAYDADSDDDGIKDGYEANWNQDMDGDGLINALDPDLDNDGLPDGLEIGAIPISNTWFAFGTDLSETFNYQFGDETLTRLTFRYDVDTGETITDLCNNDTDNDGLLDGYEDENGNGIFDHDLIETNSLNVDTDGDGIWDGFEDKNGNNIFEINIDTPGEDWDLDGKYEHNAPVDYGGYSGLEPGELNPNDADTDDDGIKDGSEEVWYADIDDDGSINALDPDSDGDNIVDGKELSLSAIENSAWLLGTDESAFYTSDFVIRFNYSSDADLNTKTNPYEWDTDGDNVPDGWIDCNGDGIIQPSEGEDIDLSGSFEGVQNGIGWEETDPLNTDSDRDGVLDGDEYFIYSLIPFDMDSDDDGFMDGEDGVDDFDNDGIYNANDQDSDNDGLWDSVESSNILINDEWYAYGTDPNDFQWDADMTTHTDRLNIDTDGDNVPDGWIDCNGDGIIQHSEGEDIDLSGSFEGVQNGMGWEETDPLNTDSDRDDVLDGDEYFIYSLIPFDMDSDDDGFMDGEDGVDDFDNDGIYNANDQDSDNDGITDSVENSNIPIMDAWYAYGTCISNFHWDADITTQTDRLNIDTDNDSIPDGWIDGWDVSFGTMNASSWNYDDIKQPWEGEDLNLNGAFDLAQIMSSVTIDETNPRSRDSDRDGLNDTIEVISDTYWFEAENHNVGNIGDCGNATTGTFIQIDTLSEGNYILYVKAKLAEGYAYTTLTFGYEINGIIETITVDLTDEYVWYNTTIFNVNHSDMPILIYAPFPSADMSVLIDMIMLHKITQVLSITNISIPELRFESPGEVIIYIDVPEDTYVTTATMIIDGRLYNTDTEIRDIDGDGRNEIIASVNKFIYIFEYLERNYIQDTIIEFEYEILDFVLDNVDDDDYMEIIASLDHNMELLILGYNGTGYEEEWHFEYSQRFKEIYTGDIDQDDYNEIIVFHHEIMFILGYNGTGYEEEWFTTMNSTVAFNNIKSMSITDIDNDDNLEIIISDRQKKGYVSIIGYNETGYLIEYEIHLLNENRVIDMRITDLDQDGIKEIVIYQEHNIYIYEYNGTGYENIWGMNIPDSLDDSIICDLNEDQVEEIIYVQNNDIWSLNYTNGIGYSFNLIANNLISEDITSLVVSDLDVDGSNEMAIGDQEGYIHVFTYEDSEFTEEWISSKLSGDITNIFTTTGSYYQERFNGSYLKNLTVNIGEDDDIEYYQAFQFFNIGILREFADEINQYLFNHRNESVNGFISVPIIFTSNTTGKLNISNIFIQFAPYITSPMKRDTDSDGLFDSIEKNYYNTYSLSLDSDNDMLHDYREVYGEGVYRTGTDPADHDTDNDEVWDGFEDLNNNGAFDLALEVGEDTNQNYNVDIDETNPLDPDSDGDNLVDGIEAIPAIVWFEAEYYTYNPTQVIENGNTTVHEDGGNELFDDSSISDIPEGNYTLYVNAKLAPSAEYTRLKQYFTSGFNGWIGDAVNYAEYMRINATGNEINSTKLDLGPSQQPTRDDYIISFDYRYLPAVTMTRFVLWSSFDGVNREIIIWQENNRLYVNDEEVLFAYLTNTIWHHFEIVYIHGDSYQIWLDNVLVKEGAQIGTERTERFGNLGILDSNAEGIGCWDNFELTEISHINISVTTANSAVNAIYPLRNNNEWFETLSFYVGFDGNFDVSIVDDYAPDFTVYLDKVMIVEVADDVVTTTTDNDGILEFESGGNITVYLPIHVENGIPRYVTSATMTISGDNLGGDFPTYPQMTIGYVYNATVPKPGANLTELENMTLPMWYWPFGEFTDSDGERLLLDFAGEINKYIAAHIHEPWIIDSNGDMYIPLVFHSDTAGKLILSNIEIKVGPYVTDALDYDTDDDWLSDGDEVNLYGTYSLKWDSDNDGLYDVIEPITKIETDPLDSDTENDMIGDGDSDELKVIYRVGSTDGIFVGYNESSWFAMQTLIWIGNLSAFAFSSIYAESRLINYGYDRNLSALPANAAPIIFKTREGYDMFYLNLTNEICINITYTDIRVYSMSAPNASAAFNLTQPTLPYAIKGQELYSNAAHTADKDNDGMIDGMEAELLLSPYDSDCDDDGLSDGFEYYVLGTDPLDQDTDDDGIQDGTEYGLTMNDISVVFWNEEVCEVFFGTNINPNDDIQQILQPGTDEIFPGPIPYFIPDRDTSTTTDPLNPDTDGDKLYDGFRDKNGNGIFDSGDDWAEDRNSNGRVDWDNETDATNLDSDWDGLIDGREWNGDGTLGTTETNPRDIDTDDDGLWDGYTMVWGGIQYLGELSIGTYGYDVDYDNDLVWDGTEVGLNEADVAFGTVMYGLYPVWFTDSSVFTTLGHHDDNLTTITNPLKDDTDNDGLIDGYEDENTDGEYDFGYIETDPLNPDTDYDGLLDGIEDWDQDGHYEHNGPVGYGGLTLLPGELNPNDADTDDDGILDGSDGVWNADLDGDGLINALDPESDGDMVLDSIEADTSKISGITNKYYGTNDNPANPTARFILNTRLTKNYTDDGDSGATTDPYNVDSDGDGLWDGFRDELINGVKNGIFDLNIDTHAEDRNADGKRDFDETYPTLTDTDGDGLWDGVNPTNGKGEDIDLDSNPDDYTNLVETNPLDLDTDDDGLLDYNDMTISGIFYKGERNYGTNPLDVDSDNDMVNDGVEIGLTSDKLLTNILAGLFIPGLFGTPFVDQYTPGRNIDVDPTTITSPTTKDSDGDGLWDGFKDIIIDGIFVTGQDSHAEDRNADGRRDPGETNMTLKDTDKDGLWDGVNLAIGEGEDIDLDNNPDDYTNLIETNPLDLDTDNDGLLDGKDMTINGILYKGEWSYNTNALDIDSDDDKVNDGVEVGLTSGKLLLDSHANTFISGLFGTVAIVNTNTIGRNVDADPTTTTSPTNLDSDNEELADGADVTIASVFYVGEDKNCNGKRDSGETNMTLKDTDNDGISDKNEVYGVDGVLNSGGDSTNPLDLDSDEDGLLDGRDMTFNGITYRGEWTFGTLPYKVDTDSDQLWDGQEVSLYYIPDVGKNILLYANILGVCPIDYLATLEGTFHTDTDTSSFTSPTKYDTDGDRVWDGKDSNNKGEDLNLNGKYDTLSNGPETNPNNVDSDGDGIQDGVELFDYPANLRPYDCDSDDDGIKDGYEASWSAHSDNDGLINALDPDSDGDGVYDSVEVNSQPIVGTDYFYGTDSGIGNWRDDKDLGVTTTDPIKKDTDGDGLSDGYEDKNFNGLQEIVSGYFTETGATKPDSDGDGILDGIEENTGGYSPLDIDSDDDGIRDDKEDRNRNGVKDAGETATNNYDSDEDGVFDGTEIGLKVHIPDAGGIRGTNLNLAQRHFIADGDHFVTDPLKIDSDGDGLRDGGSTGEDRNGNGAMDLGTSPWSKGETSATMVDSDKDKMPDGYEAGIGLDPTNPADAILDKDGDSLCNVDEYLQEVKDSKIAYDYLNDIDDDADTMLTVDERYFGTLPYINDANSDLDADGLTNIIEYRYSPMLDLSEPDTDGDGILDGEETIAGTDGYVTLPFDEDTDKDTIMDGDETSGWYVYLPDTEWHVTSNPTVKDTDGDSLLDTDEYLRTDPTIPDTDGDGLTDYFPTGGSAPSGKDNDPVAKEDLMPTMSDIAQNTVLDWGVVWVWFVPIPVVENVWLTLKVTATDNAAMSRVEFKVKDSGATFTDTYNGDNNYQATFNIDFWCDYTAGYEVEVKAYDLAGNVMAKTAGGGLSYALGQLVAGFLSFMYGAAMAGMILGFFIAMAVSIFEDLTMFLQIGAMFDALKQIPTLLGQIIDNPMMILDMIIGMLNGLIAKANCINPFGKSLMTIQDFGFKIVDYFKGITVTLLNADWFVLAFLVGSIIGTIALSIMMGGASIFQKLGITGKLKEVKSIGKLADGLKSAGDAVKKGMKTVGNKAILAAKNFGKGLSKKVDDLFIKIKYSGKRFETANLGAAKLQAASYRGSDVMDHLIANPQCYDELDELLYPIGKSTNPAMERQMIGRAKTAAAHPDPNIARGARAELKGAGRYMDDTNNPLTGFQEQIPNTKLRPDMKLSDGTLVDSKSFQEFPTTGQYKDVVSSYNNYKPYGKVRIDFDTPVNQKFIDELYIDCPGIEIRNGFNAPVLTAPGG